MTKSNSGRSYTCTRCGSPTATTGLSVQSRFVKKTGKCYACWYDTLTPEAQVKADKGQFGKNLSPLESKGGCVVLVVAFMGGVTGIGYLIHSIF